MLIITRRVEDSFTITTEAGTQIIIKVVCARDGACRLGIEAPPEIAVLRDNARVEKKHAL